jgi:hypothetical protein
VLLTENFFAENIKKMMMSTNVSQYTATTISQSSREKNLRKLRLQLLFGPGLICVCGPPACGKTQLVSQILGLSPPLPLPLQSVVSSPNSSSNNISDEINSVIRRRPRDTITAAAAQLPQATNTTNGSTVVAYISAASASSASHAIRRLGREARRCVRLWSDPPTAILSAATGELNLLGGTTTTTTTAVRGGKDNINNNNPNSSSYSATESKSIEGAVAAASLDIKAAFEEMIATVAAKNKRYQQQLSLGSGNDNVNSNQQLQQQQQRTANLLHKSSNTFGTDPAAELMEPPILHLIIDDVDLIELPQKKSYFGRGKQDHDVDAGGMFSGNNNNSTFSANWESFDQAIESLFKNVSLSNLPARGKRVYDAKMKNANQIVTDTSNNNQSGRIRGQATYDLCTSCPILNIPSALMSNASANFSHQHLQLPPAVRITNPSAPLSSATGQPNTDFRTARPAVAIRISSGIYIWVITQTPIESRCLFERTCFFVMPSSNEIAKEAAKIARESLLEARKLIAASPNSTIAAGVLNDHPRPSATTTSGRDAALLNQSHRRFAAQSQNDAFYDLEQLEKAAGYFTNNAPTCHSLVVRDARLLGARLVAIIHYLQKTTPAGSVPKLTPPILAKAWSSAAVFEEQVGAARRDADLLRQQQQQQMMMMQQQQVGEDGNPLAAAQTPIVTVNSSALVASLRCLPVAAQLLALAAFCCGALSEATLKAVLGDTSSFIRQVRGGGSNATGRGGRTANTNANNAHTFMMKHVFGPTHLAWAYDAIVRVATSIQEAKQQDNNNNKSGGGGLVTLGTCCWTPGKLSNCLPSGFLAQHHLLSLEALGVVAPVRTTTGTQKYRCSLMPNDAATLAKQFEIDIWQLTTGASVRNK